MSTLALPRRSHTEAAGANSLVSMAALAAAHFRRRLGIWRDRRRLQALPDHLLSDIGISRADIPTAVEFGRMHGCGQLYRQ